MPEPGSKRGRFIAGKSLLDYQAGYQALEAGWRGGRRQAFKEVNREMWIRVPLLRQSPIAHAKPVPFTNISQTKRQRRVYLQNLFRNKRYAESSRLDKPMLNCDGFRCQQPIGSVPLLPVLSMEVLEPNVESSSDGGSCSFLNSYHSLLSLPVVRYGTPAQFERATIFPSSFRRAVQV